jgi:hypothetical protein
MNQNNQNNHHNNFVSKNEFVNKLRLRGVDFSHEGIREEVIIDNAYYEYHNRALATPLRDESNDVFVVREIEHYLKVKVNTNLDEAVIDILLLYYIRILHDYNYEYEEETQMYLMKLYVTDHSSTDSGRFIDGIRGIIRANIREIVVRACDEKCYNISQGDMGNASITRTMCYTIKCYLDNRIFDNKGFYVASRCVSKHSIISILAASHMNLYLNDVYHSQSMLLINDLLKTPDTDYDVKRICKNYIRHVYNELQNNVVDTISNINITNYLRSFIEIIPVERDIITGFNTIEYMKSKLYHYGDFSMLNAEDSVDLFSTIMELTDVPEYVHDNILYILLFRNILNGFESLDAIKYKIPFARMLAYYMIIYGNKYNVFSCYHDKFMNITNKTDEIISTSIYQITDIFRHVTGNKTLNVFGDLYAYNQDTDHLLVKTRCGFETDVVFDNHCYKPHAVLSRCLSQKNTDGFIIKNEYQLSPSRVCDIVVLDNRNKVVMAIEYDGYSHSSYNGKPTLSTIVRNILYTDYYRIPLVVVSGMNNRCVNKTVDYIYKEFRPYNQLLLVPTEISLGY